jgi:hypothetical protein
VEEVEKLAAPYLLQGEEIVFDGEICIQDLSDPSNQPVHFGGKEDFKVELAF